VDIHIILSVMYIRYIGTVLSQCYPRKSPLNNTAVDLETQIPSSFTFRTKISAFGGGEYNI
jgi:hypothetical protein